MPIGSSCAQQWLGGAGLALTPVTGWPPSLKSHSPALFCLCGLCPPPRSPRARVSQTGTTRTATARTPFSPGASGCAPIQPTLPNPTYPLATPTPNPVSAPRIRVSVRPQRRPDWPRELRDKVATPELIYNFQPGLKVIVRAY